MPYKFGRECVIFASLVMLCVGTVSAQDSGPVDAAFNGAIARAALEAPSISIVSVPAKPVESMASSSGLLPAPKLPSSQSGQHVAHPASSNLPKPRLSSQTASLLLSPSLSVASLTNTPDPALKATQAALDVRPRPTAVLVSSKKLVAGLDTVKAVAQTAGKGTTPAGVGAATSTSTSPVSGANTASSSGSTSKVTPVTPAASTASGTKTGGTGASPVAATSSTTSSVKQAADAASLQTGTAVTSNKSSLVSPNPVSSPSNPQSSLPAGTSEIVVEPDKVFEVRMSGHSWTYTGAVPDSKSLTLVEKKVETDAEVFKFRPTNTTARFIQFQKTELTLGIIERHEIGITFSAAQTAATGSDTTLAGFAPPALTSVATPQATPFSMPTDIPGLIAAIPDREAAQDYASLRDVLEALIQRAPTNPSKDAWLFKLGQVYENSPSFRDYRKAYASYQTLVASYPYSPYLDQARERGRYIYRNYINP